MRFLVLVALCLVAPVGAAPRVASTRANSFEETFSPTLSEINRVQNPDLRALLRIMRQKMKQKRALTRRLVFSRDQTLLLFLDADDQTRCLRRSGDRIEELPLPKSLLSKEPLMWNPDQVDPYLAAFSPDGNLLACQRPVREKSGQFFEAISLLDTRTWKVVRVLKPQSNTISSIAFSHDGKRLIGGNLGGGATIYDVASGQTLSQWHYKNNFKSLMVAFAQTPEGEKAVALTVNATWRPYPDVPDEVQDAGAAEPAQLWDIEANQEITRFPDLANVRTAAFSSTGTQVAMWGVNIKSQHEEMPAYQLLLAKWAAPSHSTFKVENPAYWAVPVWTPDEKNVILPGVGGDCIVRVFQTPTP